MVLTERIPLIVGVFAPPTWRGRGLAGTSCPPFVRFSRRCEEGARTASPQQCRSAMPSSSSEDWGKGGGGGEVAGKLEAWTSVRVGSWRRLDLVSPGTVARPIDLLRVEAGILRSTSNSRVDPESRGRKRWQRRGGSTRCVQNGRHGRCSRPLRAREVGQSTRPDQQRLCPAFRRVQRALYCCRSAGARPSMRRVGVVRIQRVAPSRPGATLRLLLQADSVYSRRVIVGCGSVPGRRAGCTTQRAPGFPNVVKATRRAAGRLWQAASGALNKRWHESVDR